MRTVVADPTRVGQRLWANWSEGGSLPRGGDMGSRLPESIGSSASALGVVLPPGGGGSVHGLGFNTGHDGVAFELAYFLPEISVGPLSVIIRVECDVPNRESNCRNLRVQG